MCCAVVCTELNTRDYVFCSFCQKKRALAPEEQCDMQLMANLHPGHCRETVSAFNDLSAEADTQSTKEQVRQDCFKLFHALKYDTCSPGMRSPNIFVFKFKSRGNTVGTFLGTHVEHTVFPWHAPQRFCV